MEILKWVKEIKSKEGELHFKRFSIFACRYFSIYIHHIYKADQDKHLHNHPWNYVSMVIKGSYLEQSVAGVNHIMPFSFNYAKRNRFHKILKLNDEKVISIFITGKRHKTWGYNVDNFYIEHDVYRQNKRNG